MWKRTLQGAWQLTGTSEPTDLGVDCRSLFGTTTFGRAAAGLAPQAVAPTA